MENQLVEVARFPSSFQASLARRELEEAGVSVRLSGEASAEWMTHLGTQDAGVGLLINAVDLDQAREILERHKQFQRVQKDGEGEEKEDNHRVGREWAHRALFAAVGGLLFFPLSLYAIWLIIRCGLLSKRNTAPTLVPLTAMVIAIVGLVVPAVFILDLFFR